MNSESRGVVFTDLDGTLFGPRRDPIVAGSNPVRILADDEVAATDAQGSPIAWRTATQRAFFERLMLIGDVVAVTGRSVGAFGRVRLPLARRAVVHHGAVILGPEGRDFADATRQLLIESHDVIAAAAATVDEWIARDPTLKKTTQVVEGLLVEVCVKQRAAEVDRGTRAGGDLPRIADDIEAAWRTLPCVRVHRNGNNLALLPGAATKERAVRFLRERVYNDVPLVLGVGDSSSDYGFMAACDFALVPTGSQLDAIVRAATMVRAAMSEGAQRG
jgi:hypothetical protein